MEAMRPETEIFADLAELCRSPGFVHAIAWFDFRDNLIRYGDQLDAEAMESQHAPDRLLRTEIATLIGLMVQSPVDGALPSPERFQDYIDRTQALLEELHQSMSASWRESFKVVDGVTDKAAGWKPTRGKFRLFQIDHSQAYYTPEACTNQVETLWAQMRVNGRVHRSIARNYLDLYATDAAWTLGKGKKAPGVAFGELMTWMSRPGRSPLAGYFQGRKRFLPVCKSDHTLEGWKPSNKQARTDFLRKDKEPVEYKPRRPLAKTCREGFTFAGADAVLSDPSMVPDGPGVYAIFLRQGRELFQASGYIEHRDQPLWTHEDADHAYTGETYGIRSRLQDHLKGDVYASDFRESLMAIQTEVGLPHPWESVAEQQAGMEQGLTDWLRMNAVIGWKSCGYVKDVEDAILDTSASPLNIARHHPTGYTRLLQALRRRFRAEMMDQWSKTSPPRRPVRR